MKHVRLRRGPFTPTQLMLRRLLAGGLDLDPYPTVRAEWWRLAKLRLLPGG